VTCAAVQKVAKNCSNTLPQEMYIYGSICEIKYLF